MNGALKIGLIAAIVVIAAAVLYFVFLSPLKPPAPNAPESTSTAPSSGLCRTGNPLAGVYHPARLNVLKPCQTITGIVEKINTEDDSDYHINVKLDAAYSNLLVAGNDQQGGDLVIEIICAHESFQVYIQAVCRSYHKPDIALPHVGDHIKATGPYVIDTKHGNGGWAEIHPVWALSIFGN